MVALAVLLGFAGGVALAVSQVVALPAVAVAAAALAWLASLVVLVAAAFRRARREGRSFRSALWLVTKDAVRWGFHTLP